MLLECCTHHAQIISFLLHCTHGLSYPEDLLTSLSLLSSYPSPLSSCFQSAALHTEIDKLCGAYFAATEADRLAVEQTLATEAVKAAAEKSAAGEDEDHDNRKLKKVRNTASLR